MTERRDQSDPPEETETEQRSLPEVPEPELPGAVVAMLFSATEPARLQSLGRTTGYDARKIRTTLEELAPELARLGLALQWTDREHVQLSTSPALSGMVRRFLGIDRTTRLSTAALEVLAIIGYRQPVTRPEIDSVRGVDSSGVIQTLLARELIEPVGRLSGPGNPVQFGTTGEFLRVFGLTSLEDLPELPENLTELLDTSTEEQSSNAAEDEQPAT